MYDTQLNAFKYSYNAHGMQCMEFLRLNLQNPSQKLHKNLFDFEKPQIFQPIPKSRLECMKCMIKGLKRDHTCEICNEKTKE